MQSKFSEYVDKANGVKPLNEAVRDTDGTFKANMSYNDMQVIIKKIKKWPAPFIKDCLVEYISENEHAGWDGFDRRDLAPIKRMLEDFVLFFENYE